MSVTAAEAIANYQANPNIAPQVVVDTAANVAANLLLSRSGDSCVSRLRTLKDRNSLMAETALYAP